MYRLAVFSIVLALAAGQNGALLCRIACHPDASATPACAHHDALTPTRITGGEACAEATMEMAAVVREEVRSGVASSDMAAAPVLGLMISPPPGARTGWPLTASHRLEGRPLPTVLRI